MPLKDPEARKAYSREYAQKHKAYERVKKWRLDNPEKRAEQNRQYAKKHPEKIVAKTQRWIKNNPEKAKESNKKSRLKNAARVNANKAKYRAAKIKRTPSWLTKCDLFELQCVYTYRTALKNIGLSYEVDHIIPLQGQTVSGLHVPENLQVIRKETNRIKSNLYGY